VSYLYHFTPEFNVGTVLKYVGSKSRTDNDPIIVGGPQRNNTPSYFTADLALHYYNYANRFSLTGSVKNIADAEVYYPSEPYTYVNDYLQEGRTFMFTLSKDF
jgi:outer membrane receptor protein involved in Fe transport